MRIPLLGVFLLCAGCAGASANLSPARGLTTLPRETGLVIFSSGAEAVTKAGGAWVEVKGPAVDTGGAEFLVRKAGFFAMDRGFEDSDFAGEHGQVRMVESHPGTLCLEFFMEKIRSTVGGIAAMKTVFKPRAKVRVQAGTVTYAGSLFLAADATLTVRDQQERDMNRAVSLNPGLKGQPVVAAPFEITETCQPGKD